MIAEFIVAAAMSAAATPSALPERLRSVPTQKQQVEGRKVMMSFGKCVVRNDTAGARELLSTRIDSKAETDAIRTLSPAISGCVPQGEQVRIGRVRLRLGLATMYYRLADALAPESEA